MATTVGCRPPRKGGTGLGKSVVRTKMEAAQKRARKLGTAPSGKKPRKRATIGQKAGQKKAASIRRGAPGAKAKLMMKCRQNRVRVTGGVSAQTTPLGTAVSTRR